MNKSSAVLMLVIALTLPAPAELIQFSLLEKPARPFSLKLDIFSGITLDANGNDRQPVNQGIIPPVQDETVQKTVAEEIYQSISYEGYIIKNSKKTALLNISGESFLVGEQDLILEKIKILKISKDMVSIEYESRPYEIKIKGDENG